MWKKIHTRPKRELYPYICGWDFLCKANACDVVGHCFGQGLVVYNQDKIEYYLSELEINKFIKVWAARLEQEDNAVKDLAVLIEQEFQNLETWFERKIADGFEPLDNQLLQNYYTRFYTMFAVAHAVDTTVDIINDYLQQRLLTNFKQEWGDHYGQIYFNVLSQPSERSLTSAEEIDLYNLALLLQQTLNQNQIEYSELIKIPSVRALIEKHIKTHNWILYNYFGQFWEEEVFLRRLEDLIDKDTVALEMFIKESQGKKDDIVNLHQDVLNKLKPDANFNKLLSRLHEFNLLQQHKDKAIKRINTVAQELLEEVAIRLDISIDQLNLLAPEIVSNYLLYSQPLPTDSSKTPKGWLVKNGQINPLNQIQITQLFSDK